jgi:hypothetical protein
MPAEYDPRAINVLRKIAIYQGTVMPEPFELATPHAADRPVSRVEAYGHQPIADVHPNEDKVSQLILEEDTIQSRLARVEMDDGTREEIRLLFADAFQRWRNALKPAG